LFPEELRRRGHHTIDGDEDLAYWGDPKTGAHLNSSAFEHWIWDVEAVKALVADQTHGASFFCGGSRNFARFIDLFDEVFILEIDLETLNQRLALRTEDDWGGPASDGESGARRQHATKEGLPSNAIGIDATAALASVVDAILGSVDLRSL
jgi:hypothetical protein